MSAASAQTTVTLNQPKTQVVYATIRGGSYANKNQDDLLETRASDNPEYLRRALVKFDTQKTIPAGSAVTSAILTMTVKDGSEDATRSIGAYQTTMSWTETEVTWKNRRSGQRWTTPGGDIGTKLAAVTVGNKPGTRVSFDVTPLVRDAVAGHLGSSRYTRILLADLQGSTSASYRAYYTPDEPNASLRPTLKVTYGKSTKSSQPAPAPKAPSTGSSSTLRVLHWNTHHGGVGTDGKLDANRLITWVAKFKPDIISMNEVERYTGWGNVDDPSLFASLLKAKTGRTWYARFTTASGASKGNGNLILSRFPFDASDTQLFSHTRAAVGVTIHVNGRAINFVSTHLDDASTSARLQEIGELTTWAKGFSEQRIIAGDFNAWPGSTENAKVKQSYYDSWAEAKSDGTAVAYPGNSAGNTRNSRIDYIYYSKGAGALRLKSSQVFDVRDSHGVMPSDHRPVLSIFEVK